MKRKFISTNINKTKNHRSPSLKKKRSRKSGSWCGTGTKKWQVLNVLIFSSSSQVKDFIKTRTLKNVQQDVNMTFIHMEDKDGPTPDAYRTYTNRVDLK